MFFWILQRIILSFLFIAIIHYIYVFFKENLTIPKVKDLVNKPTQQYNAIYKSMSKSDTDTKSMKHELQKYLLPFYRGIACFYSSLLNSQVPAINLQPFLAILIVRKD